MIRIDRAVLVEAAFKLGGCVESLTAGMEVRYREAEPSVVHGPAAMTPTRMLSSERVENVRKALTEVMQLLSKEASK